MKGSDSNRVSWKYTLASWFTLPEPRAEEELTMPDKCMNELKVGQSSTEHSLEKTVGTFSGGGSMAV